MRNGLALAFGVALILAALYLAAGSTSQDTRAQPEVAQRLATELHTTPSATPTVTRTPAATRTPTRTPTPVPAGLLLKAGGIEIRLPQDYDLINLFPEDEGAVLQPDGRFERRTVVSYVVDCEAGFPRGASSLRIAQVTGALEPGQVPFVVLGLNLDPALVGEPARVRVGSNEAYRVVVGPLQIAGPVKKLLYYIRRGDIYWLVMFTAPAAEFDARLPAFVQSMGSFKIN